MNIILIALTLVAILQNALTNGEKTEEDLFDVVDAGKKFILTTEQLLESCRDCGVAYRGGIRSRLWVLETCLKNITESVNTKKLILSDSHEVMKFVNEICSGRNCLKLPDLKKDYWLLLAKLTAQQFSLIKDKMTTFYDEDNIQDVKNIIDATLKIIKEIMKKEYKDKNGIELIALNIVFLSGNLEEWCRLGKVEISKRSEVEKSELRKMIYFLEISQMSMNLPMRYTFGSADLTEQVEETITKVHNYEKCVVVKLSDLMLSIQGKTTDNSLLKAIKLLTSKDEITALDSILADIQKKPSDLYGALSGMDLITPKIQFKLNLMAHFSRYGKMPILNKDENDMVGELLRCVRSYTLTRQKLGIHALDLKLDILWIPTAFQTSTN